MKKFVSQYGNEEQYTDDPIKVQRLIALEFHEETEQKISAKEGKVKKCQEKRHSILKQFLKNI